MGTFSKATILTFLQIPQRRMVNFKFLVIALVLIGAWAASASAIEDEFAEEKAMDNRSEEESDEDMENMIEREEEEGELEKREVPDHCMGRYSRFYGCRDSYQCNVSESKRTCRFRCRRECLKLRRCTTKCRGKCRRKCKGVTRKFRKNFYCNVNCNQDCWDDCD